MEELRDYRERMYEETKSLSPKEFADRINRNAENIMKKYNIKLRQLPPEELERLKKRASIIK